MKKFMSLLVAVVWCLSLTMPLFASEDSANNALSDVQADAQAREIFIHSNFVGKDKNGSYIFESEYNPNVLTRSDKLNNIETKSVISVIPVNDEDRKDWDAFVTQRASYQNYGEQWDGSRSTKIYSTVYYTRDGSSASLTKITGGYSISDRTIKVTGQSITYGCNQGILGQNATVSKGTSSSWTIYPPSSWQPINPNTVTAIIGATSTVTVQRNADPWTITLVNQPLVVI